MSHPDGWKDEEGDVDESPKGTYEHLPQIKAPDTSAQTCGCDPGAHWKCMYYPKCAFGKAGGVV